MINLKRYSNDTFVFHKNVIEKKNISSSDPKYKERISKLDTSVENQHKVYINCFNTNTLENIVPEIYTNKNKEDLKNLYTYKSKLMQDLKIKLTTTNKNRTINTCQNCTINSVNSFDHYLPKEEYSEFSVNPINLIPSCTECNNHKSIYWKEDNKRIFLNLYLDILPCLQYLYVDLKVTSNSIKTHFFLQKQKDMDENQFSIIYEHYSRLHLFQRFSENSNDIITNLENSICANLKHLSLRKAIEVVIETSNRNRKIFGLNFWKSILEIALVNNVEYIKRLK